MKKAARSFARPAGQTCLNAISDASQKRRPNHSLQQAGPDEQQSLVLALAFVGQVPHSPVKQHSWAGLQQFEPVPQQSTALAPVVSWQQSLPRTQQSEPSIQQPNF